MAVNEAFDAQLTIWIKEVGADKVKQALNRVAEPVNNLANRIEYAANNMDGGMEQVAAAAKKMNVRFKMEWLSVMFFGMEVRRVLGGVFKGIVSDFQKVAGSLHPLNVQFGVLGATFTYLKYSVVEALSGLLESILPTLIEWMMDLADWISDNPEKVEKLAIALASIFVIAITAEWLGKWMLFWNSMKMFMVNNPGAAAFFTGLGIALKKVAGIYFLGLGLSKVFTAKDVQDVVSGLANSLVGFGLLAGAGLTKVLGKGGAKFFWAAAGALVLTDMLMTAKPTLEQLVTWLLQAGIVGAALASSFGISGAAGAGIGIGIVLVITGIKVGVFSKLWEGLKNVRDVIAEGLKSALGTEEIHRKLVLDVFFSADTGNPQIAALNRMVFENYVGAKANG